MKVVLDVNPTLYRLLAVLGEPHAVLLELIDHATQGVYRPGAWERGWICQAFGDEWIARLEAGDPWGREGGESYFQRPAGPVSALDVVCPTCQANTGDRCWARNGGRTSHVHVARVALATPAKP